MSSKSTAEADRGVTVIPTFRRAGVAPGPHLVVFGAIHGNEVCGPLALQRLMEEFESGKRTLLKGTCTFVPVCNARAFAANTRYIEENLNRVFLVREDPTSHEGQLANELAPLVHQADYLLDLHSMQADGEPFVFLNNPNRSSEEFCHALGVPCIMKGWPELYAAHPDKLANCTQSFADRLAIPNALIECGRHDDPQSVEVAYRTVLNALNFLGLCATGPVILRTTRFLELRSIFFREHAGDTFVKTWRNFEPVRQGDIVGHRATGEPVRSNVDGFIVFPSPVSAVGTEWFYVAESAS